MDNIVKETPRGKIVQIGQLLPEQLQQPVRFDEVELSEEELELAISEAKVKKHERLEYERKKRLAEVKIADLKRPWTPNELYEYCRVRATQMIRFESGDQTAVFEPKEFQRPAITALSFYFANAPEFEDLDHTQYNKSNLAFSLNKGIWLWGNPGVGKTLMMQMFSRNRRQCFRVIQCPKLVFSYVKGGEDNIAPFSRVIPEVPADFNFHQEAQGICYNDLGIETTPAKHYGTPINVLESIFMDTYENKVPFSQRHVTTNLTAEQLKEVYGVRFVDRVKQCFNIIEIQGASLRK